MIRVPDNKCSGVLLLPTGSAASTAASAELWLPHPGSTGSVFSSQKISNLKATLVSQRFKRIPLHSHRVNPSLSSRPKLCSQEHQVFKLPRNLRPIGISREFIMLRRRSADNNSEPAAASSDPAPTSTAAATTTAGKNEKADGSQTSNDHGGNTISLLSNSSSSKLSHSSKYSSQAQQLDLQEVRWQPLSLKTIASMD